MSYIINKVLEPKELDGAERAPVTPVNVDLELTRLVQCEAKPASRDGDDEGLERLKFERVVRTGRKTDSESAAHEQKGLEQNRWRHHANEQQPILTFGPKLVASRVSNSSDPSSRYLTLIQP